MTMPDFSHPDDERLAAYAGGDRDAIADPSLVAHISSCDRCGPLVEELSLLRGALAELPDLAPSRPLRLIPPVPAPAANSAGGWLRRLTGPAMAAGAGLVLVGAIGIGATGAVSRFFSQAASAVFQNVGDNLEGAGAPGGGATASDNAYQPGAYSSSTPPGETKGVTDAGGDSEPPSARSSAETAPTPAPGEAGPPEHPDQGSSDEQPWLTLLIAGTGLFLISTALRFTIVPRAG
jgi:hypothetical protein